MSVIQGGIQAHNIALQLGKRIILRDVSMHVPPEKSLVLMGQSGVGKSVLLRCILGLLPRNHGVVKMGTYTMEKDDPTPPVDFFQKAGVVFQSYALFDSLTVWENVSFRVVGSEKKRRDHAAYLLNQVELSDDILDLYPGALSGGMKRRVSIARAIALAPAYLFFDEPTEGLDPILSHKISQLIRKVITQLKATAITISHDMHNARVIGDYIALLNDGTMAWHGKTQDLLLTNHPIMKQFISCSSQS